MNNIQIFNNELFGQVRGLVIDEKPYFVGKDVAEMLGYKKPSNAINTHCKHALKQGIVDNTGFEQPMNVIPMGDVLRLVVKSNLPGADAIEEWIMDEVIPQLLITGVYITESATNEAISFESKYGIRRIRKTFRETSDIIGQWEEYKELSKIERDAHRIDNKERIKRAEIIIDELQDYIANNALQMKLYELPLYQGVMLDIRQTCQRWTNKMYGGKISNKTRELKTLKQQNEELKQQVEELTPEEKIWTTVDYHGFTLNRMFEGGHKTSTYSWWIKNFPVNQVPTREEYEMYQGIDFTKPIGIDLHFINKPGYDTDNLVKSSIDMIFNRILQVDDNIVIRPVPQTVGYCDSTDEGKIIFAIYNIDIDL